MPPPPPHGSGLLRHALHSCSWTQLLLQSLPGSFIIIATNNVKISIALNNVKIPIALDNVKVVNLNCS